MLPAVVGPRLAARIVFANTLLLVGASLWLAAMADVYLGGA
jgi:hypothetical protein